ncbi:MAG: phage holin family protein [Acidimicrobiales bacterium]
MAYPRSSGRGNGSAGGSAGGSEERPLGELITDVTAQLQQLVRKEMELARVETKEQIARAGKGAGAFGAAGAVGFVALVLLAFAAAWGLAEVIATGLAFLLVGVVFAAVAGALAAAGKAKLAKFSPVPQQTVQTVKEDVETAKESLQRGVSSPEPSNPYDAWGRH